MEHSVNFLSRDSTNYLLLKLISTFKYVSEDELSDLSYTLRNMLKGSKRLFNPFYDEEEGITYLLRKGWVTQVFSPITYTVSSLAPDENTIQKGFEEACGRSSNVIQQFLRELAIKENRGVYLRRIAAIATAYSKVPEHLQMDFLLKSGIDENAAKEAIQIFKKYMVQIEGLTFSGYR